MGRLMDQNFDFTSYNNIKRLSAEELAELWQQYFADKNNKTVRDTVRKYLKGEIDITLKTEELQEQIEENKSTIAENEEEIKDTLTEVVLSQQNRIRAQENEIADLKSQRRDIDG